MALRDKRIRVLVVHPRDLAAPTIGGIQTFLHDFVKFSPEDFEITLAGVTQDPAARPVGRRTEVTVNGRTAWSLPLAPAGGIPANPRWWPSMALAQLRLRRWMLSAGAILQVHRPYRGIVLAGHRGPRVQFVHVDIRNWPGPIAWSHLSGLYNQFSNRGLEGMDRIFVVNEPGVEMIRHAYPSIADRVEFLPVWYDEAVFHPPSTGERADIRRTFADRLGLPQDNSDEHWILFCGRLDPIKDPELAVDAFAELVSGAAGVGRLLIAGGGQMSSDVERRASRLGIADRVHLLGDRPRDEVALLMRASDLLLLTSRAEGGGPRVVLESLASGLPVVAGDVGDVRRTVVHRANGWIVGNSTASEFASGMRWVLEQPFDRVAAASVAAVRPYTARSVLAHLYDTYRQLAAGRGGS